MLAERAADERHGIAERWGLKKTSRKVRSDWALTMLAPPTEGTY